jgi:hypothetical protein
MPQDFSKAKIYKITNDFDDDVYVGSTCDTLVKSLIKDSVYINATQKRKSFKVDHFTN